MTKRRLPKGFRHDHDDSVICPHRDCSCCPECSNREEMVNVYGRYYWMPDAEDRKAFAAMKDART